MRRAWLLEALTSWSDHEVRLPSSAGGGPTGDRLAGVYDAAMSSPLVDEFYGHSGFLNWGYWDGATRTQCAACEALMEELLAVLPRPPRGRILDVACGRGATTRALLRHYPPRCVTGINISDVQLAECRVTVPGCDFLRMDATALEFDAESFGAVICVEAAFHFHTRERFLREALRVLEPGGCLMLSDILFERWADAASPSLDFRNHVADPAAYQALLEESGFERVTVRDVTERCKRPHFKAWADFFRTKRNHGAIRPRMHRAIIRGTLLRAASARFYVIASARKPTGAAT